MKKNLKFDATDSIARLENEGYKAVFIAIGKPYPRPLTFDRDKIEGQELDGVKMGLDFLGEVTKGNIPPDYFKNRKVIVIGGGNVAFDVARTAARVGGKVTVICLENADKTSKDGISADIEEIKGLEQEGIHIIYSRGVSKIIGENGKFKKIECPECTSVFDEKGFNPQFDTCSLNDVEGDVLLITVGQMSDRVLFQKSGLLDEKGKMNVNPLTLQSAKKLNVFVGGDARKIGFAADAMKEGIIAAESIHNYLRGVDLKEETPNYDPSDTPDRLSFKKNPKIEWVPAEQRMNFDLFEKGFGLKQAIDEATRCLECGPCMTCKACITVDIKKTLPIAKVDEKLCSGCNICVPACNYGAAYLKKIDNDKLMSYTDSFKCKGCGMCVSACPSGSRKLDPDNYEPLKLKETKPEIVCFACKFGWGYAAKDQFDALKNTIPVECVAQVEPSDVVSALKDGAKGVLLLGCDKGDCHYQDGDFEAKKKVLILKQLVEYFGIEKDRIELITSRDATAERLPSLIKEMEEKLKRLKCKEERKCQNLK